MNDPINPDHYRTGKVECIDAIEAATIGKVGIEAVCTANVVKYLYRYEAKNGLQDVLKAKWYMDKLVDVLTQQRADSESAEVSANDGWIKWRGGECPVNPDTLIAVEFRNGSIGTMFRANRLRWQHHGAGGDIIAYKLL